MSTNLPDDQLPPIPPTSDVDGGETPPSPGSVKTPTPPLPKAPTPPPLTSPSSNIPESPINFPLPDPNTPPAPGTLPTSSGMPTPPTSDLPMPAAGMRNAEEPVIGAPKKNEVPTEANFPGQPVPESEQVKLEQKAENIVGVTSASKAKKTKKIVQTMLGVLTLLVVGGGLLVATDQVQIPGIGDVRQQAVSGGTSAPCSGRSRSDCSGCVGDGAKCVWSSAQERCRETSAPTCGEDEGLPQECEDPTPNNCDVWCGACGGFCGDYGFYCQNKTCNQQAADKGCQAQTNSCPNPANGSIEMYYCEGADEWMGNGCQEKDPIPGGVRYDYNGGNCRITGNFCGLIQVDQGSSYYSQLNTNGCDTSTPPPPTPTPTPTPPPETLACVGLSSVPATPKLGDSVRYTCSGTTTSAARINHYNFQYKIGDGQFQTLAAESAGSAQSTPLVISDPGTYAVRCQMCMSVDDTNCSAWQTL